MPLSALDGLHGRVALVTGANHGIGAATSACARRARRARLHQLSAHRRCARRRSARRVSGHAPAGREVSRRRARGRRWDGRRGRSRPRRRRADSGTVRRGRDRARSRRHPRQQRNGLDPGHVPPEAGGPARPGEPAGVDCDHRSAVRRRCAWRRVCSSPSSRADSSSVSAQWGRIVSLTSGGPLGFPEEASYGAAKAALVNYTMTAALELAEHGVTANAVHPPVTDTGWITPDGAGVRRGESRALPRRRSERGRGRHRVARVRSRPVDHRERHPVALRRAATACAISFMRGSGTHSSAATPS